MGNIHNGQACAPAKPLKPARLPSALTGGGLIGVWLPDLRARKSQEHVRFSEAVRNIAAFYDGVVVPGALIVLASGGWMTARYFGGGRSACHIKSNIEATAPMQIVAGFAITI